MSFNLNSAVKMQFAKYKPNKYFEKYNLCKEKKSKAYYMIEVYLCIYARGSFNLNDDNNDDDDDDNLQLTF